MSFQRCKSSFRDDVPWLSKTSCLCVFGVFGIFGISKVFGSNLVRTTLILLNHELDFKSGSAKIRTLNRTFGPVPKSSVRTLVQNRTMTSLLPEDLTIEQAIDLFHVHCHKDNCFFRYATTFIPGAAVVAAQILESLWSTLNTISPKLRTASLPHRAETLDDHACDSNNKKMLAMTETLRSKYIDAKEMVLQATDNFTKINRTIEPVMLHIWEQEIQLAEKNRLKDISAMDIYSARIPLLSGPKNKAPAQDSGPEADSDSDSEPTLQDQWMEFALLVEETQSVLFI